VNDVGLAARWRSWAPQLHSVLRIVAAFMFIPAGTMKFFGVPFAMPGGGTVPLVSELGLASVLEIVGGGLMLVGLFTRPVAFLLAGEMSAAGAGPWSLDAKRGK
jgi:putative oxidoreductase